MIKKTTFGWKLKKNVYLCSRKVDEDSFLFKFSDECKLNIYNIMVLGLKKTVMVVAMLALGLTLHAQPSAQEQEEQAYAQRIYEAQVSDNDSAFYAANLAFMDYLKQREDWDKYYRSWMNRALYDINYKHFHRAFSEIHHMTEDIRERHQEKYLYIPNMALGLYYNSRNQPEMGEEHFRRALRSIDTEHEPVAVFNCYLSLAQSLSFKRPSEAMTCLDSLPQQMLQNPMYESGVLGYRCIIANMMGDDEAFNNYFAQYDSIRQNMPAQFNAANLEQVMVCRSLMQKDYQRALAWCDSIDVPLTATELRLNIYEDMGDWERAFRASELKDSLSHAADREVLEENLVDLSRDIELLQAEREKAELRHRQLLIVGLMSLVIIALLVGLLVYRYKKNRRLKEQYMHLQAAQASRRAVVSTMHEMLETPVSLLLAYARAYNDSSFHLDPETRSKRYQDIVKAARSIESLIDPVLDTYMQGAVGITDEQRQICRDALRSPLLTLISTAEVIIDGNDQIPHDEYMQMRSEVSRDTYHVATSIHELVLFSLHGDDIPMPKSNHISLNVIGRSILNSFDMHCSENGRNLATEFRSDVGDDVKVNIHPLLQELVNCLLDNANKYATGGTVLLSCHAAADGTYAISVSNEGPVIPAADAERIFEPFVRLSSDEHSLGIGLSLARRLAISMGYTIALDQEYTKGARFVVSGI